MFFFFNIIKKDFTSFLSIWTLKIPEALATGSNDLFFQMLGRIKESIAHLIHYRNKEHFLANQKVVSSNWNWKQQQKIVN